MHPSQFRMPFGKHKGKSLGSIDVGYLAWLANESEIRRKHPKLIRAVEAVLSGDVTVDPVRDDCIVIPRSRFNSWFRKLTARFHPDVRHDGGAAMTALNTARDELVTLALSGGAS